MHKIATQQERHCHQHCDKHSAHGNRWWLRRRARAWRSRSVRGAGRTLLARTELLWLRVVASERGRGCRSHAHVACVGCAMWGVRCGLWLAGDASVG